MAVENYLQSFETPPPVDKIVSLLLLGADASSSRENFMPLLPGIIHFILGLDRPYIPANRLIELEFLKAAIMAAMTGTVLNLPASACVSPDAVDDIFGATALMWAAARNNLLLARQLIQLKAGIRDKKDRFGYTALHYAVLNNHLEMADLLLDHNPLLLIEKNWNLRSPANLAIIKKSTAMLTLMQQKNSMVLDFLAKRALVINKIK